MLKILVVLLTISVCSTVLGLKCYSGMQGYINGDTIEQIETVDCNGTDYCVKLPSEGHVGKKHYEGAQYSCDLGECRKEGCHKRAIGGIICCCKEDECNTGMYRNMTAVIIFITIIFSLLLA